MCGGRKYVWAKKRNEDPGFGPLFQGCCKLDHGCCKLDGLYKRAVREQIRIRFQSDNVSVIPSV